MSIEKTPKYHPRYFHLYYLLQAFQNVNGQVLDIGCGKGRYASRVKDRYGQLAVFACDRHFEPLLNAQQLYPDLNIHLFQCHAGRLPLTPHQFDAVLMVDVLEHLTDPDTAISEIARVIKPGGIFHLVVPLEAELSTFDGWVRMLFKKNLKHHPIGHVQQFTWAIVKEKLTRSGFQVKRIRYSYHFLYQLLSFLYYSYVGLTQRGQYLPLKTQHRQVNHFLKAIEVLAGWLVYFESRLLANVKGQTAHITSVYQPSDQSSI